MIDLKLTDIKLCGETVSHKKYGRGQIVEFINNQVTVLFDQSGEKKIFRYPYAFGDYLELENIAISKEVEKEKYLAIEMEAEMKRLEKEKNSHKFTNTINVKQGEKEINQSNKSNIAFKSNYCDGGSDKNSVGYKGVCSDEVIKYNIKKAKHVWCSTPESVCNKYLNGEMSRKKLDDFCKGNGFVCYESQMLRLWRAYAGITQKGDKKGQPMTFRQVEENSLAILTTRLPDEREEERFIFAVFLIDKYFEGSELDEGYVSADPKYRIELSPREAKRLKFWDFYYNPKSTEKIFFGSGLHRYLTDIQAAQILKEICAIKKGTVEEELAKEFLEHYCEIKGINIDSLPIPNGALSMSAGGSDMNKTRCPHCGSVNTVRISYGLPTERAFEAEKRGELVLGGCCIFPDNPTRHCKDCGHDFGNWESEG